MDDAGQLMARVREHRDAAAFEALYERYARLVHSVAFRLLGDSAAAEDLTQAVFVKLWNESDAYREGNFAAWIARVARNRSLDVLRSRAARPVGEMPVDMPIPGTIDEAVFARIDAELVRDAVARLPAEQRAALELGYFDGLTHEQIAARTHVPLGTVKTRIRAALRKLRAEIAAKVKA